MRITIIMLLVSLHTFAQKVQVDPSHHLTKILQAHDCDKDKKITVDDGNCGAKSYQLTTKNSGTLTVEGTYQLSNLVQELKLAEKTGLLETSRISENPVDRISRSIRERFWDGLTRRIDAEHLEQVLADSKVMASAKKYLYVPASDPQAYEYFKRAQKKGSRVEVLKLPGVDSESIQALGARHGLLALGLEKSREGKIQGVPYVVPGGRFNEMYGWDSYFHALGLLEDGRVELAKSMVDNFVYEITHYGKILNANRTYYLTRSQPPFLTSMIKAVYEKLPADPANKQWLKISVLAAIREYETVWMGKDRLTPLGLSRYAGFAPGIPPEVEPGHFDETIRTFAARKKMTVEKYTALFTKGLLLEPELTEFFLHDRAVRESGHDTTYRWRVNGKDACADFVTVDLNSLLYKYEIDLAYLIGNQLQDKLPGYRSENFSAAARKRRDLIRKYLWDPEKKMFFDYNWVLGKPSEYVSATALYPLWAVEKNAPGTQLLDPAEAKALASNVLQVLEQAGGIAATSDESLKKFGDKSLQRQWEYPNGWAPHQILAWEGLQNYGLVEDSDRLIYKWLYMITKNAMEYNGTIPEKYDVVNRTHKVFAEYGNVGTEFSYITTEGFGWMNASYQIGLKQISKSSLKKLKLLVDPKK
ncbi:MAG TPA: trehalase family glycosidase [Bacteriovoracaceae bacterium]|nr:trehalase family glycosidase [Bacteriovoracaceae bacterium]